MTQRVRGSSSGRPIMALLDLLGRRWTLRILWELREGALNARALRSACDEASPSVLHARIKDLAEAGFVEHLAGSGYRLTSTGAELLAAFGPLYAFADRWRVQAPAGSGPSQTPQLARRKTRT